MILRIDDKPTLTDAIILVDKLVDYSLIEMNQCYMGDIVKDARHSQALKLQAVGHDMALQCESLRASLFDWHRRITRLVLDDNSSMQNMPRIANTDFGLWVLHKGDLLLPESVEIIELKRLIESIQLQIHGLTKKALQSNERNVFLNQLDELVTSSTMVLSAITERTIIQEGGRDALTKLFNRRFLRTILQRETQASISTGKRFAVVLVDVDHFKKINDTYGHNGGDSVLRQMAEVLLSQVRAGDFVFRYGGEEFLLLLSDITTEQAQAVSEKIRLAIEDASLALDQNKSLSITISLGIAMHDGHPDHGLTVTNADAALYAAKQNGRNRCMLWKGV